MLCDGLERSGWEIDVPKAGMFVWAKIPEPWAQMGSIDFSTCSSTKGGIAVSPGRGFGNSRGLPDWRSSKTASACDKPPSKSSGA